MASTTAGAKSRIFSNCKIRVYLASHRAWSLLQACEHPASQAQLQAATPPAASAELLTCRRHSLELMTICHQTPAPNLHLPPARLPMSHLSVQPCCDFQTTTDELDRSTRNVRQHVDCPTTVFAPGSLARTVACILPRDMISLVLRSWHDMHLSGTGQLVPQHATESQCARLS